MYIFMGLVSRLDIGMVASSSPVGGSGKLHVDCVDFYFILLVGEKHL